MFEAIEFVPKADAREDMRWHVLGVGRRRRDFRVTLGCLKAFLRERRIVVEMDEIVGDAGVLGLALEDRFQQRRAFELVDIGLVSRGSRDVERDRVRDLSLVIVRIARCDLLFRREIPLHARAMVDLIIVDVHRGDRIDVLPLALRLGTEGLAFFHGFETERKVLRRRRRVWIVQIA